MPSVAYSGIQSNVLSGALDMDCATWKAVHKINTFDMTTTADAGWDNIGSSTQNITGSFDFFYNPAKYPYGTANLGPGSTPTLKLYVNQAAGNFLTGTALILELSFGIQTKDGFKVTASFQNKGPWTLPTT